MNVRYVTIGLVVLATLVLTVLDVCASGPAVKAGTPTENISRHTLIVTNVDHPVPYLLYHPTELTKTDSRSLLIYLYGAGGSIKDYNLERTPYAKLRAELAQRGYYIVVPELGPRHFMNNQAKHMLDAVVDNVLTNNHISTSRVCIMGTSMGAGSALAYAIHRPGLIHAVCAVMPMTDFAAWTQENPSYAPALAKSFGGTPEEKPKAYDDNSALKHLDVFAKIPVFLIHGDADTTVPCENSKRLADALKVRGYTCTFRTVHGAKHSDAVMTNFQDEVADFFDAALK